MPREVELELGLDDADDAAALRDLVARKLRVPEAELPPVEVRKRSIDARRGRVNLDGLRLEPRVGVAPDAAPSLILAASTSTTDD